LGLSFDNLFNLNDNFNFSRAANDFDHKASQRKGVFTGYNYSIPFKRHLLSFGYSKYSYSFYAKGDVGSRFSGVSVSKNISHDLILIKRDKYKITSNLNLLNREIENFTDDTANESSSRKASNLSAGFTNVIFFDKASLLLKPSYVKGLKILNARKDPFDIRKDEAHSQFEAYKFYANYSHNLEIPLAKIPFNYNLNFDSQIAKKTLYSNDQIFAGGPFTVRGFENGSISGDSGYVVRNELKFNLAKLVNLQNTPQLLHKFSITPFYDYGQVRLSVDGSSGRLAGSGFKVDFNAKNFNASLTHAWVVSKSALLGQDFNENQGLYFNISTEIGFF
jgi:hemolysin activation/secretion protein